MAEKQTRKRGESAIDCKGELERLHAMSFAWALHCCRQRREEAQDVLQDVYLRVLDGRAKYAGRATMKTWLFTVIRRTAQARGRRTWLRAALTERWLVGEPTEELEPLPERALSAEETQNKLRTALALLSGRQQEVLHLVFYQDLTVEEAAATLGIGLGSARTHFERGKQRLRQVLQQDEMV